MDDKIASDEQKGRIEDYVWQQEMARTQARHGLMQSVAELLHVGLREIFYLEGVSHRAFFLEEDGLHMLNLQEAALKDFSEEMPWEKIEKQAADASEYLPELLNGRRRIRWDKFLPAEPDYYYYLSDDGRIEGCNWHGTFADYAHFAAGNCFRTKEEVKRYFPQMLAKLKADYQSARGVPEASQVPVGDELTLFDE